MARPRKAIDGDLVRKLASIACTVEEIAAVVGCDKRTLERRFAAVIENGRLAANASLRRKQFELAMAGDKTMLVWLGKQRLGQVDRQEHTGQGGGPVRFTLTIGDGHDGDSDG